MLFRLTPHPHERVEQIVNYFLLFFGHAPFYPFVARYHIPRADARIEPLGHGVDQPCIGDSAASRVGIAAAIPSLR